MKVVNVRDGQFSRTGGASGNQIELEIDDQSDARTASTSHSDLFCKFSEGFRQNFDSTVNHLTSSQIDQNSENGTILHFDHSVPDRIVSIDIKNDQEFQLGKEIVAKFSLLDKRGRPMNLKQYQIFKVKAILRKTEDLPVDRTLALALLEQNDALGRRSEQEGTLPDINEDSIYPDIETFESKSVSDRKKQKQFSKLKKRLENADSLNGILRRKKNKKTKGNKNPEKSSVNSEPEKEHLFDLNKEPES